MNRNFLAFPLLAALVPAPALAAGDAHGGHAMAASSHMQALSTGEIRKVDPDAQKITIRHGPLENLGMPPMTMVFRVSDPAMLGQVKSGDKVRFRAEKHEGAFVVTRIERD